MEEKVHYESRSILMECAFARRESGTVNRLMLKTMAGGKSPVTVIGCDLGGDLGEGEP